MRTVLKDLIQILSPECPAFTQAPSQKIYPYMTLDVVQNLQGYPHGPRILMVNLKIWSQYNGTFEILKLAKDVEHRLERYKPQTYTGSVKICESSMSLQKDGLTRAFLFRLKIRIKGDLPGEI
jgi:hypothetical protein